MEHICVCVYMMGIYEKREYKELQGIYIECIYSCVYILGMRREKKAKVS